MQVEVSNFEERLLMQVRKDYKAYSKHRIDLSIARTNVRLDLVGDFLGVIKASASDVTATVRFNKESNDELDLSDGVRIRTVFNCIFITNAAQVAAWLDIVNGVEFSYEKVENGTWSLI